MKEVLVTIVRRPEKRTENIQGYPFKAVIRKEGTGDKELKFKTVVYLNDKEFGVLGQKPEVCLNKTESIKDLYEKIEDETEIQIIGPEEPYFNYSRYVGKITLKEEVAEKSINAYKIRGTFSMYPRRFDFLKKIQEGAEIPLYLKKSNSDTYPVVWIDKNSESEIGFLKEKNLEDLFKNDNKQELIIKEVSPDNGILVLIREEKNIIKEKMIALNENLDEYCKKSGLSEKEVKDRLEYLSKYPIPEKSVQKIFENMEKYKEEIENKVPKKPKTLFIDSDNILKRAISNINIGSHLMLEGLMGTGKNVLCETLAWLYKRPLYEFSMNSGVNNMDLLGSMTMENGNIAFKRSNIIEAFEEGGIIVLDEFNIALPHVLSVFNSLLDERRRINVPGYKMVEGHSKFLAIATQNPDYVGTFQGNQATKNRFFRILFKESADLKTIINLSVGEVDKKFIDKAVKLCNKIKEGVEDGAISPESINIRGFIKAARLFKEEDFGINEAIEGAVINSIEDISDREFVEDAFSNM